LREEYFAPTDTVKQKQEGLSESKILMDSDIRAELVPKTDFKDQYIAVGIMSKN